MVHRTLVMFRLGLHILYISVLPIQWFRSVSSAVEIEYRFGASSGGDHGHRPVIWSYGFA